MNTQIPILRAWCVSAALSLFPFSAHAAAESDLDESIRKVRMGVLVVEASPGAAVRVEQLRHEFWFGAALSNHAFGNRMRPEERDLYLKIFRSNFNAAVTENALKWHSMEQKRGSVDYATVNAILAWTDQNNIPLRGHNVFWGVPGMVQPWLKSMTDDELRSTLQARAEDVAHRYKGRFAEYDLNNEMLHGNYYEQRLGPNITRDMAAWMRQEDPQAVFYLNDYDITTGRRVEDYAAQIQKLLDQNVPIGGIGVQGHLHGDTFDPVALQKSLDRLAVFKLPIRVTEFNIPGQSSKYYGKRDAVLTDEEEQAKAKALAEFYRICFAHPAVEGIMMWGFWEGANWIPVSSLYRRDWSPTPAATAYRDLIYKQWWTTWSGQADAQGRCEVPAFFGKHRVTAGGKDAVVELNRKEPTKQVSLKPQ